MRSIASRSAAPLVGSGDIVGKIARRSAFEAHWCEVEDIAGFVDPAGISVLHGPLTSADCAYAIQAGVKPVLNSLRQARLWREAGGGVCDLMLDTGINRLGLPLGDIGDEVLAALEEIGRAHV